jgi:regulatory protein
MRASRRNPISEAEASDDLEVAREAALKLLERARRTRSDLTRRLHARGFANVAIEQALERLAGVGLVDDVEYALAFLRERRARRTSGRRRLEAELRRRGVTAEAIAAASARLEQEEGGLDETAAARRVLAQVERRYRALDPRTRRQRLYALLARRGFDGDAIEAALGELAREASETDDA